jgi:hypothetical protein
MSDSESNGSDGNKSPSNISIEADVEEDILVEKRFKELIELLKRYISVQTEKHTNSESLYNVRLYKVTLLAIATQLSRNLIINQDDGPEVTLDTMEESLLEILEKNGVKIDPRQNIRAIIHEISTIIYDIGSKDDNDTDTYILIESAIQKHFIDYPHSHNIEPT